jgi:type I restriction enzyme S subunit
MTGRYKAYPEYKESEVEWLGKVPQDWPIHSLKRTVDRVTNGIWGSEPDSENDLIVLRVADFNRNQLNISDDKLTFRSIDPKDRSARLLKKGDLLIEKSGGGDKTLVGCVVLFDKEYPAVTSNFVAKMTPQQGFDSSFLRYAFSKLYAGKVNFPSIKQTTGIQNLDSDAYLLESFAFPSFEEQQIIANFLDHETAKIDTLITKQEKLIELLKEKRQAVISHAVTKGLNPDAPMKDSGVEWLGEVPEHWVRKSLNYLIAHTVDNRGRTPPVEDKGIPMVEVSQVAGDGYYTSSNYTKFISRESHKQFVRSDVEENDILFVTVGATFGKTCLVPSSPDFFIAQNVVGFRCTNDTDAKYLMLLLSSNAFKEAIGATNKSSTIDNVKVSDLVKTRMVVPPFQEQMDISNHIIALTKKFEQLISKSENAIQLMKERKTALISAAVSGKIDVRDWDAQGVQG